MQLAISSYTVLSYWSPHATGKPISWGATLIIMACSVGSHWIDCIEFNCMSQAESQVHHYCDNGSKDKT